MEHDNNDNDGCRGTYVEEQENGMAKMKTVKNEDGDREKKM